MVRMPTIEVPSWILTVANNLYEIERKLVMHGDKGNALRNVERAKVTLFDATKIFFEDPMGQDFKETRTDLEVTIAGSSTENLIVIEVIKPIIRIGQPEYSQIVQKGIVVVESKGNSGEGKS